MFSSKCCFLTCIQISQEALQVVWYSHLFLNVSQLIVIHTVKGFGTVNKAEIGVLFCFVLFSWNSCFFDDPVGVGNLISGSSAFSKSSLNIWKFTVHVLLKPGLGNFKHHFASVWVEWHSLNILWHAEPLPLFNSGVSSSPQKKPWAHLQSLPIPPTLTPPTALEPQE